MLRRIALAFVVTLLWPVGIHGSRRWAITRTPLTVRELIDLVAFVQSADEPAKPAKMH